VVFGAEVAGAEVGAVEVDPGALKSCPQTCPVVMLDASVLQATGFLHCPRVTK
jgi:hypothetical protein